MPEEPPTLTRRRIRWRGFVDAGRGLAVLVRTQPNARFHLAATAAAVAMGGLLRISSPEWAAIALAIGLVWVAEALNTAVEFTVDLVSPERHPLAGWAKDTAAAAVLAAAIVAAVVGLCIFGPRLVALAR